ncbi:MAG: clan AA aspartic protease [Planctomycetes bacterium]|nr:clan AA aspartic protease [Planctomycetota bacterium]
MITGRVSAEREGVVRVQIGAPRGKPQTLEAVVDTGFTESVALRPEEIAELGLPLHGEERVVLADGSDTVLPVYWGVVAWLGASFLVPVFQTEGGALVGMALLHGCRLTMDVVEDGPVQIQALPNL